jgi:hypothetical protein
MGRQKPTLVDELKDCLSRKLLNWMALRESSISMYTRNSQRLFHFPSKINLFELVASFVIILVTMPNPLKHLRP